MSILNKTCWNKTTHLSVLLTPDYFMSVYSEIYLFDEDVLSIRETSISISIIFMLFGIIGNIISLYAFTKRKLLENKFNFYLLVVSAFRLIFCVTIFTDYFFNTIADQKIFLHDFNRLSSIIIDFILHTSDSCIAILTVFLSMDRLYAIKNPMKVKEFITHLHAKFLIGFSVFNIILFKAISFAVCELNVEDKVHIVYCTFISPTIFNLIPLLVILVLNTLLVSELVKYYRNALKRIQNNEELIIAIELEEREDLPKQRKFNQRSSRRHNTSASLCIQQCSSKKMTNLQKSHCFIILVIDIWCTLTSIPYYFLNTFFILFHLNIFDIQKLIIIQIISSVFFNSNYCISIFIYFIFYNDFRVVLMELFKKYFSKKRLLIITV